MRFISERYFLNLYIYLYKSFFVIIGTLEEITIIKFSIVNFYKGYFKFYVQILIDWEAQNNLIF